MNLFNFTNCYAKKGEGLLTQAVLLKHNTLYLVLTSLREGKGVTNGSLET